MNVATETQYGVEHVRAEDNWSDIRLHETLESAQADYNTCGMFCSLIYRAPGEDWRLFEALA